MDDYSYSSRKVLLFIISKSICELFQILLLLLLLLFTLLHRIVGIWLIENKLLRRITLNFFLNIKRSFHYCYFILCRIICLFSVLFTRTREVRAIFCLFVHLLECSQWLISNGEREKNNSLYLMKK